MGTRGWSWTWLKMAQRNTSQKVSWRFLSQYLNEQKVWEKIRNSPQLPTVFKSFINIKNPKMSFFQLISPKNYDSELKRQRDFQTSEGKKKK